MGIVCDLSEFSNGWLLRYTSLLAPIPGERQTTKNTERPPLKVTIPCYNGSKAVVPSPEIHKWKPKYMKRFWACTALAWYPKTPRQGGTVCVVGWGWLRTANVVMIAIDNG